MRAKRKLSDEHKCKIGLSESGEKHWNYGKHWDSSVLEKMRKSHLAAPEGEYKQCNKCHQILPIADFGNSYTKSGRHRGECKLCRNEYNREYKHQNGIQRPMCDAKESPVYLGVHVAERALSTFFEHIERMPYGNPGYDFICGKGFKIDVKSSCLHPSTSRNGYWKFQIKYNKIADYFLCLAFNDRESLDPMHVWLIPGNVISDKKTFNVSDSEIAFHKWGKYEKPIGKVETCCGILRGNL